MTSTISCFHLDIAYSAIRVVMRDCVPGVNIKQASVFLNLSSPQPTSKESNILTHRCQYDP